MLQTYSYGINKFIIFNKILFLKKLYYLYEIYIYEKRERNVKFDINFFDINIYTYNLLNS